MSDQDPLLAVLRSIDSSLKTLVQLSRARVQKTQSAAAPRVATDRELDGKHGDKKVNFNPRDWTGESFKGRTYSECPAEFLEMYAGTLDYLAGKAEAANEVYNGKPTAPFKRADAAKARGWAKRIRDGTHTPPVSDSDDSAWSGDSASVDGWS